MNRRLNFNSQNWSMLDPQSVSTSSCDESSEYFTQDILSTLEDISYANSDEPLCDLSDSHEYTH